MHPQSYSRFFVSLFINLSCSMNHILGKSPCWRPNKSVTSIMLYSELCVISLNYTLHCAVIAVRHLLLMDRLLRAMMDGLRAYLIMKSSLCGSHRIMWCPVGCNCHHSSGVSRHSFPSTCFHSLHRHFRDYKNPHSAPSPLLVYFAWFAPVLPKSVILSLLRNSHM